MEKKVEFWRMKIAYLVAGKEEIKGIVLHFGVVWRKNWFYQWGIDCLKRIRKKEKN